MRKKQLPDRVLTLHLEEAKQLLVEPDGRKILMWLDAVEVSAQKIPLVLSEATLAQIERDFCHSILFSAEELAYYHTKLQHLVTGADAQTHQHLEDFLISLAFEYYAVSSPSTNNFETSRTLAVRDKAERLAKLIDQQVIPEIDHDVKALMLALKKEIKSSQGLANPTLEYIESLEKASALLFDERLGFLNDLFGDYHRVHAHFTRAEAKIVQLESTLQEALENTIGYANDEADKIISGIRYERQMFENYTKPEIFHGQVRKRVQDMLRTIQKKEKKAQLSWALRMPDALEKRKVNHPSSRNSVLRVARMAETILQNQGAYTVEVAARFERIREACSRAAAERR